MARTATTKQIAAALGVTESTVQLYSRERRVPYDTTPGGHRRYDIDEVKDALDLVERPSLVQGDLPTRAALGAGTELPRSAGAALDVDRRTVRGEETVPVPARAAVSAVTSLIKHSRRVLVAAE